MILLIDNYDSFVFNLARYLERLGQETHVVRNDAIDVAGIRTLRPAAIVLSPGPCAPQQAGCSVQAVKELHGDFPMLGVCLGHQAIAEAFGGGIVRAAEPMHGRTSPVFHDGDGLFAGVPNPMIACRYHSLIVDEPTLPECLMVQARTADRTLMALQHRQFPVFGVQFHPEAILTEAGYLLLANFLRLAGLPVEEAPEGLTAELDEPALLARPLPTAPVTF